MTMAPAPLHSLLQLPEPVFLLNGTLTIGARTLRLVGASETVELPHEFGPQLSYFTRLRSFREVAAVGPLLGFDGDDVDEMVTSGLLWRASPGEDDQLIHQLAELRIQPLAGAERGPTLRAVLAVAAGGPLGPAVAQVSDAHSVPDLIVWRHLAVELTCLLRAGQATLTSPTTKETCSS